MAIRLVQLVTPAGERRVGLVDRDDVRILGDYRSIYQAADTAIRRNVQLSDLIENARIEAILPYGDVHELRTEWRFLPAFDHPEEPARCLVSGTGLTHLASAQNRQAMHAGAAELTDSMRMYLWGVEGGKPAGGAIGAAPEWFYKGCGASLRGHGEPLVIPGYAGDGGEEPEAAGAYIIDPAGLPRRVGLMIANEFSDHRTEKKNYLYLAPSKLRNCAIGPELVVGAEFDRLPGTVSILRGGDVIWSREIMTGEVNMSHSLANLEHHHFKFEQHRRPGDAHVHFFGADAFSFGAGVVLADGDVMEVAFPALGRPLRNTVRTDASGETLIRVPQL